MTTAIPAEAFACGDARKYRRGCRCDGCRVAVVREDKRNRMLRETGRALLRPAGPARRHLEALLDGGMMPAEVEVATGVHRNVLYKLSHGDGRVHAETERKILAVPVPDGVALSGVYRDGTGTRRRLQGLVVMGWPVKVLAGRLGCASEYVHYLLAGKGTGRVALKTLCAVRKLSRELHATSPEQAGMPAAAVRRTRNMAGRHGWLSVAVWDDIDDPQDVPQCGARVLRDDAIVEDTAYLARTGLSRVLISERMGLSWDYITKAHSRAGVRMPEVAS